MTRSRGFTLIELMIAVAIIAILAAIAIPAYTDYIRRGRITEAFATLSGMRVKMEQYFQDNRTYAAPASPATIAPLPATTTNFNYRVRRPRRPTTTPSRDGQGGSTTRRLRRTRSTSSNARRP